MSLNNFFLHHKSDESFCEKTRREIQRTHSPERVLSLRQQTCEWKSFDIRITSWRFTVRCSMFARSIKPSLFCHLQLNFVYARHITERANLRAFFESKARKGFSSFISIPLPPGAFLNASTTKMLHAHCVIWSVVSECSERERVWDKELEFVGEAINNEMSNFANYNTQQNVEGLRRSLGEIAVCVWFFKLKREWKKKRKKKGAATAKFPTRTLGQ